MNSTLQQLAAANPITDAEAQGWASSSEAADLWASIADPTLVITDDPAPERSSTRRLALLVAAASTVLLAAIWSLAQLSTEPGDVTPVVSQDLSLAEDALWVPARPAASADAVAEEFVSSVLGLDAPIQSAGDGVTPRWFTVIDDVDVRVLVDAHDERVWAVTQVNSPPAVTTVDGVEMLAFARDERATSGVAFVRAGPETHRIRLDEEDLARSTIELDLSPGERPASALVILFDDDGNLVLVSGGSYGETEVGDDPIDVATAAVLDVHGDAFPVTDTNIGTNGRSWFVEVVGVGGECLAYEVVGVGPEATAETPPRPTGETLRCPDS